jgi:Fe-S-cluster containining protein
MPSGNSEDQAVIQMTNESELINTDDCRTCGACCKTFSLPYPKVFATENPLLFSEVKRFRDLETELITVRETPESFIVTIHAKCKHLEEKNGRYRCLIHNLDRRPKLCKEYPWPDTEDCPHKRGETCAS